MHLSFFGPSFFRHFFGSVIFVLVIFFGHHDGAAHSPPSLRLARFPVAPPHLLALVCRFFQ
jgi:hypothetical protein